MSADVVSRSRNECIEPRVSMEDVPLHAIRKKTKCVKFFKVMFFTRKLIILEFKVDYYY